MRTKYPLFAITVVCFAIMAIAIGCSSRPIAPADQKSRLNAIGAFLCERTLSGTVGELKGSNMAPDIVHIGDSLPEALEALRPALVSGYTIDTKTGDAFGEGDGVTDTIIIRTARTKLLIRMRYDRTIDRFHIVGFANQNLRLGALSASVQDGNAIRMPRPNKANSMGARLLEDAVG